MTFEQYQNNNSPERPSSQFSSAIDEAMQAYRLPELPALHHNSHSNAHNHEHFSAVNTPHTKQVTHVNYAVNNLHHHSTPATFEPTHYTHKAHGHSSSGEAALPFTASSFPTLPDFQQINTYHNANYHHNRQTFHPANSLQHVNAYRPQKFQGLDLYSQNPHQIETLSQRLARNATTVASQLGTKGDCARGPRLTFDKLGYHLPQVVATEQGRIIEQSGLFQEVPRSQVRPGDYAYRHWNNHVIKEHGGVDKGDAFIVAQVGPHGELYGANDHQFVVPEDGGRYTDTKFFRPNDEFLKATKQS